MYLPVSSGFHQYTQPSVLSNKCDNDSYSSKLNNKTNLFQNTQNISINPHTDFIDEHYKVPPWWSLINSRLSELKSLEENWDGEGAPPVNKAIAKFTIELLLTIHSPIMKKPPAIVPLFNGDLQIEWRDQNFYIVVHVIEPKRMVAMRSITAEKRREHTKVSTDFALIKRWVVELFEKHSPEQKSPFITMIRQKTEANILPISDRSQTKLSIGNHFVNSIPSEFRNAA
ncbi:MAG: hypothetical protein ORN98_05770 [Alphaproteobacteria bacterium]|nr:hypothetical protein [Alphaproteobacteria bacterium]